MSFREKISRDPRVVFAAALNRQGLLADPKMGANLGQPVKVNGIAQDVGNMGDGSLDDYFENNMVSNSEILLYATSKVGVDTYRSLSKAFFGVASVAAVAAAAGPSVVAKGVLSAAPAFAITGGYLHSRLLRHSRAVHDQVCSIQIREGNQRIIAHEIIRRDPDVQRLQFLVNGKNHTLVLD